MWYPRHVSLLIQKYKENPCLFLSKHPWFNNKHAKHQALEEIRKELLKLDLEVDIPSIKNKFHSLKTKFLVQYRKYHNSFRSGMADQEINKPTLWYYDQIKFLVENSATVDDYEYDAEAESKLSTWPNLGKHSLLDNQDDDSNDRLRKRINIHNQISREPQVTTSCSSSIYSRSPSRGSDVLAEDSPAPINLTVQSVLPKSSIKIFSEFVGSQLEYLKCNEHILLETQQDITNVIWAARRKVCSKNLGT